MDEPLDMQLNIISYGKLKHKFKPKYHSKKQRVKEKRKEKKIYPLNKSSNTGDKINKESKDEACKQTRTEKTEKQAQTQTLENRKLTESRKSETANSTLFKKVVDHAGQKRKVDSQESEVSLPFKIKRTGPFISSLFKNNPQIPTIKSAAVNTIKEDVFTSKCFSDLPLSPNMVTNLEGHMKMSNMTTVQQLAIPTILQGRDALIKSQTGSGKTLAYAVPIIQKLQSITPKIDRSHGPYAIVIVPTRELATQSYEVFLKVCKPFVYIVPGCLMGGEKRKAEKARIRKGINVLVGTPGRLVDHLQNTHGLSLHQVQYLVLDEADRLLDMGYEKDVAQIVNCLNDHGRTKRQTILLSATLTEGVERLAGISMSDPAQVSISNEETDMETRQCVINKNSSVLKDHFAVPQALKQHFIITPCKLRLVTLITFILSKCKFSKQKNKMIVFLSTQDSVEFHHKLFTSIFCMSEKKRKTVTSNVEDIVQSDSEDECKVDTLTFDLFKLHGDMLQKDRCEVFKKFSEIKAGVLLCTDVAARGLDLPQVSWIVQYTTPGQTSDYIHRVGRTARVGSRGQSLLFLIPTECDFIKVLNDQQISLQEMPMKNILQNLMTIIQHLNLPEDSKRQTPRMWEEAATALHMLFETQVAKHPSMTDLARKAYQSYIRAYATYPGHLKHIFSVNKIHLGHLAKSFALRDAPGTIGVVQSKKYLAEKAQEKKDSRFHKKKARLVSEFSSGFGADLGVRPRHKNIQKELTQKKLLNDRKKAKKLAKQKSK